jgi:hypothetical protein
MWSGELVTAEYNSTPLREGSCLSIIEPFQQSET